MRSYVWQTFTCIHFVATAAAAFSLRSGFLAVVDHSSRSRVCGIRGIVGARSHETLLRPLWIKWHGSGIVFMGHDDDHNDSLSHMLSSPERYAEQMGMTVDQVCRFQEEHTAASQALHQQVEASFNDGPKKHRIICEHRYRYAKHPFVCRNCWCYLPICLCQEAAVLPLIQLPTAVKQVILWTHHREWTSISNSGALLPLLLQDTKLLMKGLPQHDEEIQHVFEDSGRGHVVVLWPDNDTSPNQNEQQSPVDQKIQQDRITWQDLQKLLIGKDSANQVTLVALEGTWRTARRMASKLPATALRLSLPPDILFWNHRPQVIRDDADDDDETSLIRQSLLRPLRRQEGGSQLNLCTAEAVTAALLGLGLSQAHGCRILDLVQRKVDQTRRYRGKQ
jgi:DTW domain-containing protein YfiP